MNSAHSAGTADTLRRQANLYLKSGQWGDAQGALESLLQQVPQDTAACLALAEVMLKRGQLRASVAVLLRATRHLPRNAPLLIQLVQRLLLGGEVQAARACLDFLESAPAAPAELLAAQAHLRWKTLGEVPAAMALLEKALDAGADAPSEHLLHAMLLQFGGDIEQAIQVLERCLQRWPQASDAAMALVGLRKQTPASHRLDFLQAQLRKLQQGGAGDPRVVAEFEYALFKTLDDLGRFDEAWPALTRCNALMHRLNPYSAQGETAVTDALVDTAATLRASGTTAAAFEGPTPIFIVGLPRSGTTLLDRMLSSHSEVTSAGEIMDFWRQLHWVADEPPAGLQSTLRIIRGGPGLDFEQLGARYLQQTQWRAEGRSYYIDKLPINIRMVPFIRRALPHARILHITRDPMDVCFSNLKAMLGNAAAYSYDIQALAHHFREHVRWTDRLRSIFPDAMLEVPYASLVREPRQTLARVLDYCGLALEEGCLRPERNVATVATPSSAQVREPIHTRSLGQWQDYASQLEPLRQALAGAPAG